MSGLIVGRREKDGRKADRMKRTDTVTLSEAILTTKCGRIHR